MKLINLIALNDPKTTRLDEEGEITVECSPGGDLYIVDKGGRVKPRVFRPRAFEEAVVLFFLEFNRIVHNTSPTIEVEVRDGHVWASILGLWVRPTWDVLKALSHEQRTKYSFLVAAELQATEDRIKFNS